MDVQESPLFFCEQTVGGQAEKRTMEDDLRDLQYSSSAQFMLIRDGLVKTSLGKHPSLTWLSRASAIAEVGDAHDVIFLGIHDEVPCFALVATGAHTLNQPTGWEQMPGLSGRSKSD